MKSKIKKFLVMGAVCAFVLAVAVTTCGVWVGHRATGRLYDDVARAPERKVALVLGTGRLAPDGGNNVYFDWRLDAAEKLFKAGKVKHLILSGDNRRKDYDEPTDMKNALIARGIPESAITLDYAGFRTLDSVIRCKEIFSQSDPIVVSQAFHNARALLIGDYYGMRLIGFNARNPGGVRRMKQCIRESAARTKAVLDLHVLHKKPHFLGEKIELPVSAP
jgi:SanA protein